MSSFLLSDEIQAALNEGKPVVALESTIISHGLPRPDNFRVAREFEEVVRLNGAIPATIAVIEGEICIGLSDAQMEFIATSDDVVKTSTRDLGFVLESKSSAATTVAATAHIATRAGIQVFATGGLGGVHRGFTDNFDESADLEILSKTPIIIVCAGVKSILDVGATLERLETLGIAVCGYQTHDFPGFYLRSSGFSVDWSVENPQQLAQSFNFSRSLNLNHAFVVANPVNEKDELDFALHQQTLESGLAKATQAGITGKAVTPFLLDYFHTATKGESLRVNIQVVKQNAALAAKISKALLLA